MPDLPPTFHPHLSADGAWRWDGRKWVPVAAGEARSEPEPEPASSAAAEPAPAPAAAAAERSEEPKETKEAGETETKEAARRYGWPTIGAMIGIALAAIAALIGAALLAYRAAGSPPPNVVVTPTPQPINPDSLSYRYLAGVTVGSLTSALETAGFTCAAPAPPENDLRNWRCDRNRATQHDIVQVWGVDESHVHLVEVTSVAESGPFDEAGAAALGRQVARLIYPASASDAAAAAAWVEAHLTANERTTIGGVTLRTDRSDVASLLEFNAGTRH